MTGHFSVTDTITVEGRGLVLLCKGIVRAKQIDFEVGAGLELITVAGIRIETIVLGIEFFRGLPPPKNLDLFPHGILTPLPADKAQELIGATGTVIDPE